MKLNTLVKITLLQKSQPIREYLFDAPARFVVGRALECGIQVPLIEEFADVSRRHCQFDFEQGQLRVLDLRSLNGTRVNGVWIGESQPAIAGGTCVATEEAVTLKNGDEIRLGRKARLIVEIYTVAEESVRDIQTVIIKSPC